MAAVDGSLFNTDVSIQRCSDCGVIIESFEKVRNSVTNLPSISVSVTINVVRIAILGSFGIYFLRLFETTLNDHIDIVNRKRLC